MMLRVRTNEQRIITVLTDELYLRVESPAMPAPTSRARTTCAPFPAAFIRRAESKQRIGDGAGGGGDKFSFSSISTNEQLADAMGLSVGARFSASMGVASMSASDKVSFFNKTKTNSTSLTLLASYADVDPVQYIGGEIKLKPEYLAMVGKPAFRENYGDYVIIGEQSGRWFYGTVQLAITDTVTASQLANSGVLDASYMTASMGLSENLVSKMKQASHGKDLEISVTSSGTKSAAMNVDQFLAQVHSFPNAKGPRETYKLKAIPYEAIVANWPPSNPLAPLTAAQKLDAVTSAAFDLIALGDDSDFLVHNPALFALGTNKEKREARLGYIKRRRAWYSGQLNDMRKAAKNCDVEWKDECQQLYQKWKNFDDFSVAEYDQFPVRYLSDARR